MYPLGAWQYSLLDLSGGLDDKEEPLIAELVVWQVSMAYTLLQCQPAYE
jgi:hypothetical protein